MVVRFNFVATEETMVWFRISNQIMMELSLCYEKQGFPDDDWKLQFDLFDIGKPIIDELYQKEVENETKNL